MNDPIVDDVRRVRDAHAARFNYDLDAIFRDIKEQERKSGRKFVSFNAATTAVIQSLTQPGPEPSTPPVAISPDAPLTRER